VTDGGKQGMGKKVAMMSDDERMQVINGTHEEITCLKILVWRDGVV